MTHPDPKELLERLREERTKHTNAFSANEEWYCKECGEDLPYGMQPEDMRCNLSRTLDCAIAGAEKHAAYELGSNYCLGCYDPWPCPTLAAMTAAWEEK